MFSVLLVPAVVALQIPSSGHSLRLLEGDGLIVLEATVMVTGEVLILAAAVIGDTFAGAVAVVKPCDGVVMNENPLVTVLVIRRELEVVVMVVVETLLLDVVIVLVSTLDGSRVVVIEVVDMAELIVVSVVLSAVVLVVTMVTVDAGVAVIILSVKDCNCVGS